MQMSTPNASTSLKDVCKRVSTVQSMVNPAHFIGLWWSWHDRDFPSIVFSSVYLIQTNVNQTDLPLLTPASAAHWDT